MSTPPLIATCWTTAGDAVPLPGRDVSPVPLVERIAVAAKSGFTGFGLLHVDLLEYLRTADLATLGRVFADHGITVIELEFLTGWWADGEVRRASDDVLHLLMDASVVLRPHHVKIGPDIHGGDYDVDRWAAEFHRVSEAFAGAGTSVALEFMPFSNINTLAAAVELVRRAGHPRGGLMLDLWHLERGAGTMDEVRDLSVDLVQGVEIDDGDVDQVGDGYSDTVLRRRLCGQGAFRLTEFINAVEGIGWDGPVGVEILSETYRKRPLAESVPEAYATAAAAFDAAHAARTNGEHV